MTAQRCSFKIFLNKMVGGSRDNHVRLSLRQAAAKTIRMRATRVMLTYTVLKIEDRRSLRQMSHGDCQGPGAGTADPFPW